MDGKKQLNNSSGWAKSGQPALAPAMSWISGEKLPVSGCCWVGSPCQSRRFSLRASDLLSEASNNYWRIGFVNQQIAASSRVLTMQKRRCVWPRFATCRKYLVAGCDWRAAKPAHAENQLTGLQRERSQLLNQQAVCSAPCPVAR